MNRVTTSSPQAAGHEPVLLTAQQALARSAAIGPWLRVRAQRPLADPRAPGPADRLVLSLDTSVPGAAAGLICAVWGALRHGVIPVVLDHGSGSAELAELTADAAPIGVISSAAELAGALGEAGEVAGEPARTGTAAPPAPKLALGTIPLGRPMHYTSGTTGRRKGVFSDILPQELAAALWAEEQDAWSMSERDVHVVMSPLYHSAPLRFALASLLAGGSVLLPGRFGVSTFLAACHQHRPSTAFTAPAQLQLLRSHAQQSAVNLAAVTQALRGMRLLAHAGAPCPEPVKHWLVDLAGPERIWEFYGSTEGQFTVCPATQWLERPGTVGRARPGRSLQLDPDGRIWCTVPEHARFSYWGDEAKTAAAWRQTPAGRAFSVGDAGHLDEDGYLYLHGRRDDLIISGGVNVYPAEVERVLAGLPGVQEVAVFGVPDDRWGQRVEAAVRGTADPEALLAAAAQQLAAARRPKRVHLVQDLPRTSTGKIRRRDLPDLLGGTGPHRPDGGMGDGDAL